MSESSPKINQLIKSIESILAKGDRVEMIPVKDGVRIIRVRREPLALIAGGNETTPGKAEQNT